MTAPAMKRTAMLRDAAKAAVIAMLPLSSDEPADLIEWAAATA